MPPAVDEWLEAHADQVSVRQRSEADALKLVATFVAGIAAAMTAAALQLDLSRLTAHWAGWLLAGAVLLTLLVFALDRVTEVDVDSVLREASLKGWNQGDILNELRTQTMLSSSENQRVLAEVKLALYAQLTTSIACGAVAAIGMVGLL